jgi:hypothetical protein
MAETVKLCGEALVPSTFAVYGKATTKPTRPASKSWGAGQGRRWSCRGSVLRQGEARRGKVLSGRYQDWWLPLTAQKPECSADAGLVSHMKYMALPAVLDFSSFLPDIILHSIASLP